ncbi:CGNR zinc finger domain-containing protein [Luteipulveratus flavus]|uniref:CGNR zinc finger domain-containing protein n=1 Tax=Luteipulveratus flavus TaxID=3031728 RepID=A0ABT6C3R3_9MICO|nr:CGNR zinc finger domain-containing protein [Luteipulveratus sp. YIM 133296]MDF8263596.1 CGNR zinc finger domain-containing protein [Luteipulveratus sp. YIM 133296]
MRFDSHVVRLLAAAESLVNTLTPGGDRGRPYEVPEGGALRTAVEGALRSDGYAPRVTAAQAERFRALADRLREVFTSADVGDLPTAARVVNRLLDETGPRPRLDDHDGELHLHFHGPSPELYAGWAPGVAAGLAMALGSDMGGRLGVCEAPGCDRVYVDGSKNGGRRFCSTRCQSRVKAAAHRERARR